MYLPVSPALGTKELLLGGSAFRGRSKGHLAKQEQGRWISGLAEDRPCRDGGPV